MAQFKLNGRARQVLEELVVHTTTATVLRRAQALLWVDEGISITQVAAQLRVTRQAVHKWIALFQHSPISDIALRLQVGHRSGRPATVAGIIDPLIDEVIDHDPRMFDFNSTVWTAPLLAQYLAEGHGLCASVSSVRLALCRLEITWKRPRHTLSLRSSTWRQAKGGLKRGWRHENAPSS